MGNGANIFIRRLTSIKIQNGLVRHLGFVGVMGLPTKANSWSLPAVKFRHDRLISVNL